MRRWNARGGGGGLGVRFIYFDEVKYQPPRQPRHWIGALSVAAEAVPQLEERGFHVTGLSPDGKFVEIIELEGHPWFLGCQFHPELKSRPNRPHPLFAGFVGAALARRLHEPQAAKPMVQANA